MKKKKKIMLIEMSPFPYHIGGGYAHLCMLSKGLIERGFEVHVLSSSPADEYVLLDYPKEVILHNVGMKHKMFGKGNKLWGYVRRIFYEWSFVRAAKKKIKEINPDIINSQSLITTSLPCSLLGRPFVATLHGIYMEGFKELWEKRGRKDVSITGKFYGWLEKYNLRRCHTVVGINKNVADYYSEYVDSIYVDSIVIENSIDCKPYNEFNIFKQRNKYLFLGRISEEKGIDYLIEALKLIDKKVPYKIEFNIAGSGDKDYIQSLKDQCSMLKNITINFLGPVYGEDKIKLFKSSSVFVLPSRFESFGIVLLEAMSAKCALIASNASGPRGIIKNEFGQLVDYIDEGKRILNLAYVLLESTKWDTDEMGEAARKEVEERYSSDKAVDKYIELYNKVALI